MDDFYIIPNIFYLIYDLNQFLHHNLHHLYRCLSLDFQNKMETKADDKIFKIKKSQPYN
jgi:hypothetical protein